MRNWLIPFVIISSFLIFPIGATLKSLAQGADDPTFQRSRTVIETPDSGARPIYNPGVAFGGIPLDDSQFYEIKPEKCEADSVAEILGKYEITDDLYLLKTEKGFAVATLEQTLKEIATGQRRKKICPIRVGTQLKGEIDCKGVRVIKESPYQGCAYDAKIWGHSMTETEAFNLIYSKLGKQFKAYKKECVLPPKRTLQDRMIKF